MAGVAETSQVVSSEKSVVFDGELSPTDLTFNLPSADSASLQELIDSELALRIGGVLEGSERFIEAERTHTTATLNIFSDTIDLSPDCETVSPLFPLVSPQVENKSFDISDPDMSEAFKPPVDSDESPVTEDGSDLEPIPLFTQTITSDHEQSPLTEANPFISNVDLLNSGLDDAVPPSEVKSPQIDEVLVVIEPPDDSTPNSNDSPERISSPQDILDMEIVEPLPNGYEEQPLVILESESKSYFETNIPQESDIQPEFDSKPEFNFHLESTPIDSNIQPESNTQIESISVNHEIHTQPESLIQIESNINGEIPVQPESIIRTESIIQTESNIAYEIKAQPESIIQIKSNILEIETQPESVIQIESNINHDTKAQPEFEVEPEPKSDIVPNNIASDCEALVDSVDNSMAREFVGVVVNTEWTTVEEATKDVEEPQPDTDQLLHDNSVRESSITTTSTTTKTVKKKKSIDSTDSTSTKVKKTKKTKKSEEKENHISVKSSFSKFDQLQKKAVLHVRSSDASKIQKQLNQDAPESQGANPTCKSCSKTVFAMEQVKAERSVWHKNCFRCKECSKQLTVDTYQSHEGELFCKPHFKELFKPKAVLDNADDDIFTRRKPKMIICENQPVELPPDVVRASDKADLGLEELSALNVKSRFQVFEKTTSESDLEKSPSTINVKRSPSILSKLAKFQKKGMDVGVTDESLNGVDYEESSSSEDEAQGEDGPVKGSKLPERPISFNKMEDVKRTWESTGQKSKEELRAEHKKEISQIRSRLFQGKQGKMKEMYEQAVAESEGKITCKKDQDVVLSEKARLLKERFERGEVVHSGSEDEEEKKSKNKESEDMSVFEAGISKKSRSIFLELDATAAKTQTSPLTPPVHALTPRTTERRSSQTVSRQVSSDDVVRASDPTADILVPTADVSDKFKFFETYKAPEKERKKFRITPPREGQVKEDSPDREVYRDPNVVRGEDNVEDETIVKRSQTASRMLSLFRQMEEQKDSVPDGPKPLKCFTPPPDYKEEQSGSSEEEEEDSEEEEESEDDTGIVKSSAKIEDEFLKQAQNAARAKALKEKFEHWEPEKQSVNNAINLLESEQESIESTKSLRARFESLKAEQPKEKPRPKVNRFVLQEVPAVTNKCVSCTKTVYPLEKVEVDGKLYHANCFRCQQCQCKLRMETYTLNNDHLYCLPHFRQLFIAKGNYDEGFGSDQHKRKWEATVNGHH